MRIFKNVYIVKAGIYVASDKGSESLDFKGLASLVESWAKSCGLQIVSAEELGINFFDAEDGVSYNQIVDKPELLEVQPIPQKQSLN